MRKKRFADRSSLCATRAGRWDSRTAKRAGDHTRVSRLRDRLFATPAQPTRPGVRFFVFSVKSSRTQFFVVCRSLVPCLGWPCSLGFSNIYGLPGVCGSEEHHLKGSGYPLGTCQLFNSKCEKEGQLCVVHVPVSLSFVCICLCVVLFFIVLVVLCLIDGSESAFLAFVLRKLAVVKHTRFFHYVISNFN